MNSCVLMAEIIKAPELRYTQDGQLPIAEMLVQFAGARAEDPAETLKVVGWGNLAQQIQEQFNQGDRVVIEGRLGMNTIDRPEGFKEKRAELTATRVHLLGADAMMTSTVSIAADSAPVKSAAPATPPASVPAVSKSKAPAPTAPSSPPEPNFDDIPF
jgi:single-strand DNA-binding protein